MKIRITKVLPTSSHFNRTYYNLIGCVGDVEEISDTEYNGDIIKFVVINNCKHVCEGLIDGDQTTIFGAEFEVVEE